MPYSNSILVQLKSSGLPLVGHVVVKIPCDDHLVSLLSTQLPCPAGGGDKCSCGSGVQWRTTSVDSAAHWQGPCWLKGLSLPVRHKSASASNSVEATVYGSSPSSLSVFMTDLY